MIDWEPSLPGAGVYDTVQTRVLPEVTQLGVPKVPDDDVERVTVPDGAIAVPELVSETVTVQDIGELAATEVGEQLTVADVVLSVAVIEVIPELPE